MSFYSWLRNLNSGSKLGRSSARRLRTSRRRPTRSYRPRFEALEERVVLSSIGGPDGFGYQAETYPFEALDLVEGQPGVTVLLDGVDDEISVIGLGANTFNFYGVTYTGSTLFSSSSLHTSDNGLLSFGTRPRANAQNFSFDSPTFRPPTAMIAPLYDDWATPRDTSDQVLAKIEPNRLIVEWSNVYNVNFSPGPSGATFQAILELNTGSRPGNIIFNYVDLETGDAGTNGATATVGITDFGTLGSNRVLVSHNSVSNYVGDGKAILISFGVNTTTTVTAANATYDGLPHGATALVAPELLAGTTTFLYTGTGGTVYSSTDAPTNSGTYQVVATFTPDDLSAYHSSSASADYSIAKAAITYMIGNASHVYGSTVNLADGLGATLPTGVNGENLALDYSSIGNTVTANAGSYDITGVPSDGTGLASNYAVTLTPGILTVTQATLTGNAKADDPLNMARRGTLRITIKDVSGLVNGDSLATFLSTAEVYLTIGQNRYAFVPTIEKISGTTITIKYSLKNSALLSQLADELADNTSRKTAVSVGFSMESTNYSFTDDYLTRLFSKSK